MKRLLARAFAGAFALPCAAVAQDAAVVVTGSPFRSELLDLVVPADVLEGRSLVQRRRSSLGETLGEQPGVSSTYFGPHVSRPVIRGLDGDRIRVLQNGAETHDASALSFDHAVPYDPLVAERIEIVRGPAAVLYGGNAVGGVVNTIDNRIPQAPISGVTGRAEPRFGGAGRERSFGALVEAGNGRFAIHGDAFTRRTGNLRTPRFTVRNSDAESGGGTLGASLTLDRGYVGVSHGRFQSDYGAIPEPTVRIDMQSERTDLAGEMRELGTFITGAKFKAGRTDYEHKELDDGAIGTTFRNRGHDGRLELTHAKIGPLQGVAGVSLGDFDFSALGDEAFVPQTNTRTRSIFLYEEMTAGDWKLSFGARRESARVKSEGGGNIDASTGAPQFDPALGRSFSPTSTALGALYRLSKAWSVAANASFTERAPTYYELFANGPHAATGAWEVGDGAFETERSRSFDVGLRWRIAKHSASISVHQTRFRNFLTPFASGDTRSAIGERNPAQDPGNPGFTLAGDEILPELVYRAVPATFQGFEAQGRFRVDETLGALDLVVKGDYVKAYDRRTGQPLPRIPPLRLTLGLDYALERWSAGVEVQYARAQRDVSSGERSTAGYALVNASLAHTLESAPVALQAFVRVDNLFDREARNHVSFIKDIAPLPGRGVLAGLRASF
ncbi:MAG TPA: TonB-dependent receptor [Burkholderiales bacterium]|nr:TonB-dependent receptor [Burkholderiales bacterium]